LCNYREREFVQRFTQADLDLGSKSPPELFCTAKELGSLIPRITKWNEHLKDHDANDDDCLSAKEVCHLILCLMIECSLNITTWNLELHSNTQHTTHSTQYTQQNSQQAHRCIFIFKN
jgi:hypothetical protein